MICQACASAADQGLSGKKAHKKAGCKGKTWCDCAHKEIVNKEQSLLLVLFIISPIIGGILAWITR